MKDPMGTPMSQAQEWRKSWSVIAGATLGMSAGMYMFMNVQSFFVKPLAAEFGWSRGQIAMIAAAFVLTSLALPIAGIIIDRWGIRIVALIGATVSMLSYVGLALMQGPYWQYVAILLIFGLIGGAGTSPLGFAKSIVRHFVLSRGLGLAVSMCGVPLLACVLLPVLQDVIANHGWRAGFWLMSSLSLVFGLMSFILLGRVSNETAVRPDVTIKSASADSLSGLSFKRATCDLRFWMMVIAMIGSNIAIGVGLGSLQPMLSDRGVDGHVAALLGTWYAMGLIVGRLAFGTLLDRFWSPLVASIAMSMPVLGLSIILVAGADTLRWVAGIAFIAPAAAAEVDILCYLAARYFGLRAFGALSGLLGAIAGLSASSAMFLAAKTFDRFGSYDYAVIAGAIATGVAAIAVLLSGLVGRANAVAAKSSLLAN